MIWKSFGSYSNLLLAMIILNLKSMQQVPWFTYRIITFLWHPYANCQNLAWFVNPVLCIAKSKFGMSWRKVLKSWTKCFSSRHFVLESAVEHCGPLTLRNINIIWTGYCWRRQGRCPPNRNSRLSSWRFLPIVAETGRKQVAEAITLMIDLLWDWK